MQHYLISWVLLVVVFAIVIVVIAATSKGQRALSSLFLDDLIAVFMF